MFSVLQIGPLRSWPGGLCLSRTIGDIDAGQCIVPVPHVKQIKVSQLSGLVGDELYDLENFEGHELALNVLESKTCVPRIS